MKTHSSLAKALQATVRSYTEFPTARSAVALSSGMAILQNIIQNAKIAFTLLQKLILASMG